MYPSPDDEWIESLQRVEYKKEAFDAQRLKYQNDNGWLVTLLNVH